MTHPEPVQKGNPHKLSLDQHTFPTKSIGRFSEGGGVEVHEKRVGRTLRRLPKDVLFCARRLWDHKSETGYMRDIENPFQSLIDNLLGGKRNLSAANHSLITDFYLLWNLRQRVRIEDPIHSQLPGWTPERVIRKKDTQEKLEGKGILFWDENGEIPNRILTGTSLQMQLWAERERMPGTRWGVIETLPGQGEFLVPDNLCRHTLIPISPNVCLAANNPDQFVDMSFVAWYNGLAVENSDNYYFARNIKDCPILKHTTLRTELKDVGLLKSARRA